MPLFRWLAVGFPKFGCCGYGFTYSVNFLGLLIVQWFGVVVCGITLVLGFCALCLLVVFICVLWFEFWVCS